MNDDAYRFAETVRWTTLDGRTIALADLTDQHLENIVRMLRRRGVEYPRVQRLAAFLCCGPPAGDGARDAYVAEFSAVADGELSALDYDLARLVPVYNALMREQERRGGAP